VQIDPQYQTGTNADEAERETCGAEPERDRPQSSWIGRQIARRAATSAAPYALLAGFAIALLWPLVRGRVLYWGDILLYFDPMLTLARESLRHGILPLWNPFVECGQPFVGNPQCSLFYPATLLLLISSVAGFMVISSILHIFLCGAFTYAFLARWTMRRSPALVGALTFMGSACIVSRLQFPTMVQAAPWLPLILLFVDRCIDRPDLAGACGLGLAVGLEVLSGHAQLGLLSMLIAAAYASMRLLKMLLVIRQRSRSGAPDREVAERSRRFRRAVAWLAAGAALGLILGAAMILPAMELLHNSPRDALTEQQSNRFYLPVGQLLTLVAPRFYGHPASGDYWGAGNAWEPSLFVGWLPLLFVLRAILRSGREQLVRFWSLAAFFATWLAIGNDGGIYQVAFAVVPGLSRFHDPARFLFVSTFAIAVLAAVGFDSLLLGWKRGPRSAPAWVLAGVALPLWWYGLDWNPTTVKPDLDYRPVLLQNLASQGRVAPIQPPSDSSRLDARTGRVCMSAHDAYWRRYIADGYHDYNGAGSRSVDTFLDSMLPNIAMRYGQQEGGGYEPVAVGPAAGVNDLARYSLMSGEPNLSRLLSLMDVGTVLMPECGPIVFARVPAISGMSAGTRRGVIAYENRDRLARAWLVRRTRSIEGNFRVISALCAPGFRPQEEAILSDRASCAQPDLDEANSAGSVSVAAESGHRVDMEVDAGSSGALLVYSGTVYPGWSARVDGKRAAIHCADGAFIGVRMEPGRHSVALAYAPTSVRAGWFVTLCGLSLLGGAAGAAGAARLRRRRVRRACP